MTLDEMIDKCHKAWIEFLKGDPEPAKAMFSHGDDVTLANPFGPAVHGWQKVSEMLNLAASNFKDGKSSGFESVAKYVTSDLATHHEVEHWNARFGKSSNFQPFVLRVTTAYRRESDTWKIVLRHADPISTFDPQGPLRKSV